MLLCLGPLGRSPLEVRSGITSCSLCSISNTVCLHVLMRMFYYVEISLNIFQAQRALGQCLPVFHSFCASASFLKKCWQRLPDHDLSARPPFCALPPPCVRAQSGHFYLLRQKHTVVVVGSHQRVIWVLVTGRDFLTELSS